MSFERFFRLISYAAVFCGFLSLWVSGSFGVVGAAFFLCVMGLAWSIEDTRWQISERIGTILIVLALPVFYLFWRLRIFGFSGGENLFPSSGAQTLLPSILARMISILASIKLLQKKSDRDWIFLYLMAFFEVLLAAGLNISALYFVSFVAYLLVMVCAIVAFEIRKTVRVTVERQEPSHRFFLETKEKLSDVPIRRLPAAALVMLVLAGVIGLPLFFVLPRVGGAGLGADQDRISTTSGFSDTVQLGGIGTIQQNDAVVMRVKLDDNSALQGDTHWRGVALDTFDNRSWKKSVRISRQQYSRGDRDLIPVDTATARDDLAVQTVYLEPIDSPVLFGLSRVVGVAGDFSQITRDSEGSITALKSGSRMTYKIISDRSQPNAEKLHADNLPYSTEMGNYLALPAGLDPRIAKLASDITAKEPDRFAKALAVESYLQNNFGYTLEMKASGPQPLADFLFNVKEGHCEYFATAMAVMLRTQGIATRIVNGFQEGEYNDAVDMWIVRQRDAHSWVEVYFPKEKTWVSFDPTPAAGRSLTGAGGFFGGMGKYLEALETVWVQYFVAFDDDEQQSLVRSARKAFSDYELRFAIWISAMQDMIAEWWAELRGDYGLLSSLTAIAYAIAGIVSAAAALLLFVWSYRKAVKWKVWTTVMNRIRGADQRPTVEFYERMQAILAARGFVRQAGQTPLEFAFATGIPEAVSLTKKYNQVRFGKIDLSIDKKEEIDEMLLRLKKEDKSK